MPLRYANLDERTRELMLEEVDRDLADETLLRSVRLNARGLACYAELLKEAVRHHDDRWLARQLDVRGCLKQREVRRNTAGRIFDVAVPVTASTTIADGEFNAFYIRAVCRRAMEEAMNRVQVYRGRLASEPRPESTAKIGAMVLADRLLEDLRRSKGVEPAFGIPAGPNSGLTVRLPPRNVV